MGAGCSLTAKLACEATTNHDACLFGTTAKCCDSLDKYSNCLGSCLQDDSDAKTELEKVKKMCSKPDPTWAPKGKDCTADQELRCEATSGYLLECTFGEATDACCSTLEKYSRCRGNCLVGPKKHTTDKLKSGCAKLEKVKTASPSAAPVVAFPVTAAPKAKSWDNALSEAEERSKLHGSTLEDPDFEKEVKDALLRGVLSRLLSCVCF